MSYYKLVKIDIGLAIKKIKDNNNKMILMLQKDNDAVNHIVDLLDANADMKI